MALKTANLNQVSILFVNCEQKCNEDWILLHDVPKEHEIEEQEDEESELELSTQPRMAQKKPDATLLNQAKDPSAETAATISPVANPRHISKPPPPMTASASVPAANLTEASAYQPPETKNKMWADARAKSGSPISVVSVVQTRDSKMETALIVNNQTRIGIALFAKTQAPLMTDVH